MNSKIHEPDDPMGLRACEAPGESPRLMIRAYVEEFALSGMPPDRILGLFRDPFYQGTHRLYRSEGEDVLRAEIKAVFEGEAS